MRRRIAADRDARPASSRRARPSRASAPRRPCAAASASRACSCPSTWMRYMPTLRIPRFGSRGDHHRQRDVRGRRPPASDVMNGSLSRSTSSPRQHDFLAGAAAASSPAAETSPTSSQLAAASTACRQPVGHLELEQLGDAVADRRRGRRRRAPAHIRRIEPKRLIADRDARSRCRRRASTCSKSSAGPPPGLFITRSAISAISRRARTGWVIADQLADRARWR